MELSHHGNDNAKAFIKTTLIEDLLTKIYIYEIYKNDHRIINVYNFFFVLPLRQHSLCIETIYFPY